MTVNTELVRKERKHRNQNELNIFGLQSRIDQTKQEILSLNTEITEIGTVAITRFINGDITNLDAARFKIGKKINIIKGKQRKISRYLVEFNKKFSLAIACILFVLIGAPLGYLFRRGGIAGLLIGILLFSSYYILVLAGEEFADRRGFSPYWAMWLPNIVLFISGFYLFLLAEYERSPFKRFLK